MHNPFSRIFRSVILSGLVLFASQATLAGERLQFKVAQTNATEVISIYLQDSQARVVTSSNPAGAVIFDASNRKLHVLDHQRKTVTIVDQSAMEQLASVTQGIGDLARAQGGVLGDLFETFGLDNQMGEVANIEVQTLAERNQFSGQSCEMQQIFKDGTLVTQVCLSEQISLGVVEHNTLAKLIDFAQLIVQKGQIILQQFNLAIPVLPAQALKGVPIFIENKIEQTSATITGVNRETIQAAQFKIPADYTETIFGL